MIICLFCFFFFLPAPNEAEILEFLNDSDFEDSGDEEYIPEGQNSRPLNNDSSSSDSETGPEIENDEDFPVPRGRGSTRRPQSAQGTRRETGRRVSTRARRGGRARVASQRIDGNREWCENNTFSFINPGVTEPAYAPFDVEINSKFDYIQHYIPESIFELMTEKSNQTYIQRTGKALNLTVKELKLFFGITITMSCITYPILRMYWEKNWRIKLITDAMARDRFFLIRNSLKLVYDDDVPDEQRQRDKLWKIRPILDSVTHGCLKQVPENQVSLDEMMIPFSGSCGIKQYCPNKPNPVGLKAFILANPDGIVCNMVIYQGQFTFPTYKDAGYGLGESAVLHLTEILAPGTIVYYDRYFSTVKLATELISRGLKCAGTIMKNRIPADVLDLQESDGSLKRRGRGSYQVLTNADSTIAITKWLDNKPVMMLSTAHAANVTDTCSRWCKKNKVYVDVTRPEVIRQYNSKMGGVDMADRLLAVCPARSRTKKWPVRFISHMVDLSITNSWLFYKKKELANGISAKKIQQLRSYKLQYGEKLIEENLLVQHQEIVEDDDEPPVKRTPGRPGAVPIPSEARRHHGNLHLPEVNDKQQRCRNVGCDKKSTIKCSECNVPLCLTSSRNCFKSFHV